MCQARRVTLYNLPEIARVQDVGLEWIQLEFQDSTCRTTDDDGEPLQSQFVVCDVVKVRRNLQDCVENFARNGFKSRKMWSEFLSFGFVSYSLGFTAGALELLNVHECHS